MAEQPKEKDTKKPRQSSAYKREQQNERKRLQNKSFRSRVRTAFKGFLTTLEQKDAQKQMASFSEVSSLLDKGVNKGVFKLNRASRMKARMSARLVKTSS